MVAIIITVNYLPLHCMPNVTESFLRKVNKEQSNHLGRHSSTGGKPAYFLLILIAGALQ